MIKWFENKKSFSSIIYKENEVYIYISNKKQNDEYVEVILTRDGDRFKIRNISKTIKDWN